MKNKKVIGIDPGKKGAIVILNGESFHYFKMPLDKNNDVDFHKVLEYLTWHDDAFVVLERAVAFGMGVTSAFNYGRDFRTLQIVIEFVGLKNILVMPAVWTKEIHSCIKKGNDKKDNSARAAKKLFPKIFKQLPRNRNGKLLDGVVDALLIAEYGRRRSGDGFKSGVRKKKG